MAVIITLFVFPASAHVDPDTLVTEMSADQVSYEAAWFCAPTCCSQTDTICHTDCFIRLFIR